MMQTDVQLSQQSDKETRERVMTAIALSGYPAVRSMMFKIEQGVVDILGCFPSFYLCQVAIESVKRVPGVVRVINHSEIVYALPQPENVTSDGEAKSRCRSIVVLPAAEVATSFSSRTMAFRSYDESERYAGAANHD
jgi:hypothetical protein